MVANGGTARIRNYSALLRELHIGSTTDSGTVLQINGSMSVVRVNIGNFGMGTYHLQGGRLESGAPLFVGWGDGFEPGSGHLIQDGGTLTGVHSIEVGRGYNHGLYELKGGTVHFGRLVLGDTFTPGTGTVIQTGGRAEFARSVTITRGLYDMRGGELDAFDDDDGLKVKSRFHQTGGTVNVGATLEVFGIYELSGGTLNVSRNIHGDSGFPQEGTFHVDGDGVLNVVDFIRLHTLVLGQTTPGELAQPPGNNQIANVTIHPGSRYTSANGILSVRETLVNRGSFEAPIRLTVEGTFEQSDSGVLKVQIRGVNDPKNDLIQIPGAATLVGQLHVERVNHFTLNVGDTFDIMTYGSHMGTFDLITDPIPGGLRLDAVYSEDTLSLRVLSAIPGPTAGLLALIVLPALASLRPRRRAAKSPCVIMPHCPHTSPTRKRGTSHFPRSRVGLVCQHHAR